MRRSSHTIPLALRLDRAAEKRPAAGAKLRHDAVPSANSGGNVTAHSLRGADWQAGGTGGLIGFVPVVW